MLFFELEHGFSVQDHFGDHLDDVRKAWIQEEEELEPLINDLDWESKPRFRFSEANDDVSEARNYCFESESDNEEAADYESESDDDEEEADSLEMQDRPGDYYLSSDEEEDKEEESEDEDDDEEEEVVIVNGGTRIKVYRDSKNDHEPTFRLLTRSKPMIESTRWDNEVVEFLVELQELAAHHLQDGFLDIFTEHRRDGVTFRGHPNYRLKGYWRDWVVVDWGAPYGKEPSHIWCFVELEGMPRGRSALHFGGVALEDGACAVVEWATYDNPRTSNKITDLFTPLTLDVGEVDCEGRVTRRAFYLANVEAFVRPCIVIPDVGCHGDPTNEYFEVKPRSLWAKEFICWLRRPHTEDVMCWKDFEAEKTRLEEEKQKKEEEKCRKELEKQKNKKRKA